MIADLSGEFVQTLSLMRNALYLGMLLGAVCPLVGAYFVLRRVLFLGVTLPQVSSAGVALALLVQTFGWFGLAAADPHTLGALPLAGSVVLTTLALILMVYLEPRGGSEPGIGMMYAMAAACGILLVAQVPFAEAKMLDLLRGEMIGVSGSDVRFTALSFAVATVALVCFHREFLLVSYDRELGISLGKKVSFWNFLFYLVAALVISVAVMGGGPIAAFGYLVIPPLTALQLTRGMVSLLAVSAVLGTVSSLISFFAAYRLDLPLGPSSVALMGGVFLIVFGARRVVLLFRRGA